MPNPKKFDNKNEWMDTCMHQLRKEEHKDQQQSVAICINMWRDKNKKKAKRVVASFLKAQDKEAVLWTEPRKIPRLKERLRPHQEKTVKKDTEPFFAEKGEEVIEILPSGKEVKRKYNPATMKDKQLKPVD